MATLVETIGNETPEVVEDQVAVQTWDEAVSALDSGAVVAHGGAQSPISGSLRSPNYIKNTSGWRISSNGSAEFQDIDIGNRYITVAPGESIQNAIDIVGSGGVVFLLNGTHTVDYNIVVPSNVYIQGENADLATIDFNSNANQIQVLGSGAYSTGTVSVSNGSTTVTGSGTSWSANVTAGQHILLDKAWYLIAAVGSDTSITLAVAFAGVTLSGASYVAATKITDVKLRNLVVKNASGTALKVQYADEFFVEDVLFLANGQAVDVDDCSNFQFEACDVVANGVGITMDNTGLSVVRDSVVTNTSSGVGIAVDDVKNCVFQSSAVLSSSGVGMTISNSTNFEIRGMGFVENGSHGIEFVSGNANVTVDGISAESNTSDGVKLTATSDGIIMTGMFVTDNGGYGLNVAAATCDDAVVSGSVFSGNSSGAVNDSGTGTVIRGNVGVDDNATSSSPVSSATYEFTVGESLSARDAVCIGDGSGSTNVDSGLNVQDTSWGDGYRAYKWTGGAAGARAITSISILGTVKSGSSTAAGDCIGYVYTDSSGPSVQLSGTLTGSYSQGVGGLTITASTGDGIPIEPSTTYWIVIQLLNSTGGSNTVLRRNNVDDGLGDTSSDGSTWNGSTNGFYMQFTYVAAANGYLYQASAAAADFRSKAAIGFVESAYSPLDTATVVVQGVVPTMTSLTPASQYYIADSAGTISTTAGSVTRKIGIALSSTELLITNIW